MKTGGDSGAVSQTPLAKAAGNVFEFVQEMFEMNRVHAFLFYFYGFPLPLAKGLI